LDLWSDWFLVAAPEIAYDCACLHMTNNQRQLCLATGANTGIGLEVVRGLAQAGASIVLACRNQSLAGD
jgi:hypothetical protein